ncbi:hypothetical protein U1Q18_016118 [Sarracenia purpurea var. burkii]
MDMGFFVSKFLQPKPDRWRPWVEHGFVTADPSSLFSDRNTVAAAAVSDSKDPETGTSSTPLGDDKSSPALSPSAGFVGASLRFEITAALDCALLAADEWFVLCVLLLYSAVGVCYLCEGYWCVGVVIA